MNPHYGAPSSSWRGLTVLHCLSPILVQDLGRAGLAAMGVGPSGAADRGAHRLAQRLLANPESDAGLEITLGNASFEISGELMLVLTGAPVPARLNGRWMPHAAPFWAPHGGHLELGTPQLGLRTYLGVRGGVSVPPVLGSRSRDILADLGPGELTAGDRIPVGMPSSAWPNVEQAPLATLDPHISVAVDLGPRQDWFADPAALAAHPWTVSPDSNRVGIRLVGTPLRRAPGREASELPSEGVVSGSIQVPPSGQPVIFLADHPVTGGYPVIGVVRRAGLDALAQARPGQSLTLNLRTPRT